MCNKRRIVFLSQYKFLLCSHHYIMLKSLVCPDIEKRNDYEGVSAKACGISIIKLCTKVAVIRAVSLVSVPQPETCLL